MKNIHRNCDCVTYCNHCNYSVACTQDWPIHEDNTIYSLIIKKIDNISQNDLKVLKKVSNLNYIEIKKLNENDFVVFKGKSYHIAKKIVVLKENNINYFIDPKYDYSEEEILYAASYEYSDMP